MRAPISIIIPTLNAEEALSGCLMALMEGLDAELICEVIVSDGGSADETCKIAEAWGAQVLKGVPSRGGQLRRACEEARGKWLMVLHADTLLAPGWSGAVRVHMLQDKAGWFRLRFDQGGRLVSGWANIRSRLGLPYGDQGLLISEELYRSVNGYPDIPLMEDVAMALSLRGRMRGMDAVAVTSARKFRQQGWIRRGARNLWTLARYFAGVAPERLARTYR